jgi:hypothetical protein
VTDTVGQRVQRYMLDGSDKDLRRLLGIAEVMAESAATALRRSGIGSGWNVIECGCGPLGAPFDVAFTLSFPPLTPSAPRGTWAYVVMEGFGAAHGHRRRVRVGDLAVLPRPDAPCATAGAE